MIFHLSFDFCNARSTIRVSDSFRVARTVALTDQQMDVLTLLISYHTNRYYTNRD